MEAGTANKTDLEAAVIEYTGVKNFLYIVVGKEESNTNNNWSTYVNLYRLGDDGIRADYVCAGEVQSRKMYFKNGGFIRKKEKPESFGPCTNQLENREITVAHNNYGFEFQAKSGKIDESTCEGELLGIYAKRNNLKLKFINTNKDWSILNYTTGTLIGPPLLVSNSFNLQKLFIFYKDLANAGQVLDVHW